MRDKQANHILGYILIGFMIVMAAIAIPDFYTLLTQNRSASDPAISKISQTAFVLAVKMIVFAAASILYVVLYFGKNKKALERSYEELKISNERYRIVTEQSDSIIFDYNFEDKTITFSANVRKKFGFSEIVQNCPQSLLNSSTIHIEDVETFTRLCADVRSGISYEECEIRIKPVNGDYIWCKLRVTTIFDNDRRPIKAIGKVIDIDKQKKETMTLRLKAQNDPLTGLCNKITTERLITACLKVSDDNSHHAMLIMDIDNFKAINDNLGHISGDNILRDLAPKIKKLFRTSDTIGRIGGDEFMIFMKDYHADQIVADKLEAFCDLLRKTYAGSKNDYPISGSIGIAIYPKDGKTYNELYQKADIALYHAKRGGKNSYTFYDSKFAPIAQQTTVEANQKAEENELLTHIL